MADRFAIEIKLGNAAMEDPADVAAALRVVAETIDCGHDAGTVRDANGNAVGAWMFGATSRAELRRAGELRPSWFDDALAACSLARTALDDPGGVPRGWGALESLDNRVGPLPAPAGDTGAIGVLARFAIERLDEAIELIESRGGTVDRDTGGAIL